LEIPSRCRLSSGGACAPEPNCLHAVGEYQLVVLEGKDLGRIIPLEGSCVTLGRPGAGVEGAIEFEEPSVSRVHAVLTQIPGGAYELSNRSLTSPVRVDGQPATSSIRLESGSRIQLGNLLIEVRYVSSEEQARTQGETTLMGYLEITKGPRMGTRYPLYYKRSLIGRSPACEVQVGERSVSRYHAALDWFDGVPMLMHLSKNNTTLLNGQVVPDTTLLEPRDKLEVGSKVTLQWLPLDLLAEEEEQQKSSPPPVEAPTPVGVTGGRIPIYLRLRDLLRGGSLAARVHFFEELSKRLEKGESIILAVAEAAALALPHLAPYLTFVVRSGRNLGEALARFPGTFSHYETGLVGAGEEAGTLAAELQVLANSLAESLAWRGNLMRRLFWGGLVLFGLTILLLVPTLRSEGLREFGIALGSSIALAGALAGLLAMLAHLTGLVPFFRVQQELFLESIPILGPALRLRAAARFLRSLSPLLEAGLQVHLALRLAAGCTGSIRQGRRLACAAEGSAQGKPVREALAETGVFPEEVLSEIAQGEEEGNLPARLEKVSQDMATLAQTEMTRALGSVVCLLLAGMVLVLMLAISLAWKLMAWVG
jgi:pSer/pThr/pTyr-binding forkhead associated (FHA) protein